MEESPAPNLDDALRTRLHDAAVTFAKAADYRNAGTCEFVVAPDGTFGFIEMNARLQVEHPVTELVTGLDLVELQLRVALGESLPDLSNAPDGHAIEVRIYAEDPDAGFLPQSGRVEHVRWPQSARVDAGVDEGADVSTFYDPMLAKIVARGTDRPEALQTLRDALSEAEILGVRTNLAFLSAVASDPVTSDGRITTDWLERAYGEWTSRPDDGSALAVAAAAHADELLRRRSVDPWSTLGPWRAGGATRTTVVLRAGIEERAVVVAGTGPFAVADHEIVRLSAHHAWSISDRPTAAAGDGRDVAAARGGDSWFVWCDGNAFEFLLGPATRRLGDAASHLDAPLPGQVIAVHVAAGQRVEKGDELVVVEAMKMEHAIRAPSEGVVRTVLCAPGDQVARGQTLVDFEPA
jgi:acetyl/propionyl-CoA carboxylase alpha subunit